MPEEVLNNIMDFVGMNNDSFIVCVREGGRLFEMSHAGKKELNRLDE